jgi:hypothetical protein
MKKTAETAEDRAFWDYCETVAREVALWPAWMRGEPEPTVTPVCAVVKK